MIGSQTPMSNWDKSRRLPYKAWLWNSALSATPWWADMTYVQSARNMYVPCSTICQDGKRLNKTGMQKHQPFYYVEVDSRCVCVWTPRKSLNCDLAARFNTDITLQMIVQTASPLHRRKSDDFIPLRLCTSWLSAYWWPSWQCSVL